jgi:hypothetical protein
MKLLAAVRAGVGDLEIPPIKSADPARRAFMLGAAEHRFKNGAVRSLVGVSINGWRRYALLHHAVLAEPYLGT